MHPCFQNGDYPADAKNPHQNSAKSPNAGAQRNVIVKVAFFASKSEAQQNSGHGARAPANDWPARGPPPLCHPELVPKVRSPSHRHFELACPYLIGGPRNLFRNTVAKLAPT